MRREMRLKGKNLRFGVAALLAMAAGGVCRAQAPQSGALPAGVKAVWDLSKAYSEKSLTRERICINGLWLWQPAPGGAEAVPAGNWGYFKVPAPWDPQKVFANPAWESVSPNNVMQAWYQREIAVPAAWAGRRIALFADCLNSYAAVYLDGKKAGELRYPGGELDLTSLCRPGAKQTLTMLVIAMPLRDVMVSNSDTIGSRTVRGQVARRGLCGDVWLTGMPAGPRISDVKVETSVRKWEITFNAGLAALAPGAQYVLSAAVAPEGLADQKPLVFESKPFTAADVKDGRFSFTAPWKCERLWDTNTPQNMYAVSLSLEDANAGRQKVFDEAVPERFGFREMWINGRDFYLNGTRIWLFACPLENALDGPAMATYDSARQTMLRMKSFGANFAYGHNYGCEPGVHLSYAEVLRAADDVGMLVALPMPHFNNYDWNAPDADQTNGYAHHAEYYVRHVACNHPAVVMYGMSYNSAAYFGAKDPDKIDGLKDYRTDAWSKNGEARGLRCQALVEKYDTSRLIYHHGCADMSEMIALNFYINFTPIEELDNWFVHWSEKGVKPVFLCENASPLAWDFTMYRGWYEGHRNYGSAVCPWELCVAQWNAQFLGDSAFNITDQEKRDLEWESRQFSTSPGWHRWDYPVITEHLDATKPIIAMYITDNYRAWRTCGLSGNDSWSIESLWQLRAGADRNPKELKVDWDGIQRPGFSPDSIGGGRQMAMDIAFPQSDWTPDAGGQALLRNNMPLLAYIAGKPDSYTSKDHDFLPGETVAKQVIIVNDSRVTAAYDCSWSTDIPGAAPGESRGAVETGEVQRVPVDLALPAAAAPGHYKLTATVKFGTRQTDGGQAGESQTDSFQIDVMPPPQPPAVNLKLALFDPKGETAKLLNDMKIPFQAVDANADLAAYDVLVVGKEALTVNGAAPNIMRVKDGLRVIVFEQTCDAMTKRLGFRAEEYGLRRVFKRVPDSPLLAGLDTEHLRDWRGSAALLPKDITFPFHGAYEEDMVEWCGVKVHHIFRCTSLGNVASVMIEKPACGNFMPIVDGGFSLEYSPLMVYTEGKGMVLFCQMDVTGRTESDPAAETLVGNIFRYVSDWKATPTGRKAIYVGDPAGEEHLKQSGIAAAAYQAGTLSPDDVLVVGTGGAEKLAADARSVAAFIKGGGRVLALGLDQAEAQTLLPAVQMKGQEHISTFFKSFDRDSLLAGIGPADVYNAACTHIPLVTGGAEVVGDGVLAKAQDVPRGGIVFFQLPPYSIHVARPTEYNLKRAYRRTSFVMTRALADLGVVGATPLLARFSDPVTAASDKRWTSGLYVDQVEEWDDPYRSFNW